MSIVSSSFRAAEANGGNVVFILHRAVTELFHLHLRIALQTHEGPPRFLKNMAPATTSFGLLITFSKVLQRSLLLNKDWNILETI